MMAMLAVLSKKKIVKLFNFLMSWVKKQDMLRNMHCVCIYVISLCLCHQVVTGMIDILFRE